MLVVHAVPMEECEEGATWLNLLLKTRKAPFRSKHGINVGGKIAALPKVKFQKPFLFDDWLF